MKKTKMKTITLFIGAHGSEPDTHPGRVDTRSSIPDRYGQDVINFLSFAGYANIRTEVGVVFVRPQPTEQEKIIEKIKTSGSTLFGSKVAEQLNGLGTDRVTLSYLVPEIFNDGRTITTQAESMFVMEDMKKEMLGLGMLAELRYSETSQPKIDTNPTFEKMWWFNNNPGDDRRRFNTLERTGFARAAGNRADNAILSTNGLFILHTTEDEHQPFSISNIHEVTNEKGLNLINYDAIRRRNLLRKINYTSYWKKWIDAYDFSEVPDKDVIKIGSIDEAVFIVTQIYDTFLNGATDNPDKLDSVEIDEEYTESDAETPVAEGPQPPPLLDESIKNMLKAIIQPQTAESLKLHGLSKDAKENVQKIRATFLKEANAADALEKMIEQIKQGQMVTRQYMRKTEEMEKTLAADDTRLEELRAELTAAKEESAKLESELDVLKSEIIAGVTEFIRYVISQPNQDVKAAIKNIIMRNKLKNILKFGIFHKRLSLSQIILFFRSLGYNIINIVDPSCFVLKPPRSFQMDIDTQAIDDSQGGIDVRPPPPPPLDWTEQLTRLETLLSTGRSGGGKGSTKRKRSYSRKRRTRKKRYATRRRDRHRRMRK